MNTAKNLIIRKIEAKTGHFVQDSEIAEIEAYAEYFGTELTDTAEIAPDTRVSDIDQAEMFAYVEYANRVQDAIDAEKMAKLRRRMTEGYNGDMLANLRLDTRLYLEQYEAFVTIRLYSGTKKNGDSDVSKASTLVRTRQGLKDYNLLSEHSDDDMLYEVEVGFNLRGTDAGRNGDMQRSIGKSETFKLFKRQDRTWDTSGVELPETWLKAKLKDFVLASKKPKNQFSGNAKNGYSLPDPDKKA